MNDELLYIGIRVAGPKYVVYPTTEKAYLHSLEKNESDVWYFTSTKSINDFAQAGVFGAYDSYESAENAILSVDSSAKVVYKPGTTPPPTD